LPDCEKREILLHRETTVKPLLEQKKGATREGCAQSTKGGGWKSIEARMEHTPKNGAMQ